jgi:hypothetical protein
LTTTKAATPFARAQGGIKLDLANATKVPSRVDRDPAVVVVLVVVIVIENPGEETDYENDDDEDESGKAQDRPAITARQG